MKNLVIRYILDPLIIKALQLKLKWLYNGSDVMVYYEMNEPDSWAVELESEDEISTEQRTTLH